MRQEFRSRELEDLGGPGFGGTLMDRWERTRTYGSLVVGWKSGFKLPLLG
ncbi:MAG: hypothetical protein QOH78_94, partial [Verrucomicrobiota bacterium]